MSIENNQAGFRKQLSTKVEQISKTLAPTMSYISEVSGGCVAAAVSWRTGETLLEDHPFWYKVFCLSAGISATIIAGVLLCEIEAERMRAEIQKGN